ncbi:MAG TPA: periplasmic heavy metal sensor [Rhizomicrobium sp.]|nr:periplasmic heavy metal sensor [Rhizomicrobium sp.]
MPDQAPSRTRTTLMVMSLCLNVGLIALILVGIGRVGQGFFAGPGMMAPAQIARALPDAGRQKVLGIMAEHRDALREKRRAARAARLEVFRVFTAPAYVAGDLSQALDEVRAADSVLEEEFVAQQRDVINSLTPDERKLIADRVHERRGRPWWRRILRQTPPPSAR